MDLSVQLQRVSEFAWRDWDQPYACNDVLSIVRDALLLAGCGLLSWLASPVMSVLSLVCYAMAAICLCCSFRQPSPLQSVTHVAFWAITGLLLSHSLSVYLLPIAAGCKIGHRCYTTYQAKRQSGRGRRLGDQI